MSDGHRYETATISGQATAILGNKYGDVINVHQATFLLQAASTAQVHNQPSKVVRHNQVLPGGHTTVESIKTYNEGNHFQQRGAVQQTELRWKRCEDIGVGSFGEVHREQTEECGQIQSRAVKVLRRRHLVHMRVDHKKELDALIELSQPNFVHRFVEFYSWYESHDYIYLAMEYVPYGDLENYIQTGLKELDVRQIAYQVLDGIRIMHELDLIHRDIKPANVFVVQREPVWWVKIGDFSICKRSMTRQTVLRTQVGTQGYQAPEILGIIETEKRDIYDSKCDIWSFGCLVFEMLTRQLPFPDLRTLNDYCNDEIHFPGLLIKDSGGSWLIAEFAWSMLQASPADRPTADQAMFLLSYRCGPKALSQESSNGSTYIYLEDCVKRHFKIPWQYCSTWIDMKSTLRTILLYIGRNEVGQQVSQGWYELKDAQGKSLRSHNWAETVSPGMYVFLNLLPEPRKEDTVHKDLSDDLKRVSRSQPESHPSLDSSRLSNDAPTEFVEAQSRPCNNKSSRFDQSGAMVGSIHENASNCYPTITGCGELSARGRSAANDLDSCNSRLHVQLFQQVRELPLHGVYRSGTHMSLDSTSNSQDKAPDQERNHEATTNVLATEEDNALGVENIMDVTEDAQRLHDAVTTSKALEIKPSMSQNGGMQDVTFGQTQKTKGLLKSFFLSDCDDFIHNEDEVSDKKNIVVHNRDTFFDNKDEDDTRTNEPKHDTVCSVWDWELEEYSSSADTDTDIDTDCTFRITSPYELGIQRVRCSQCLPLARRGEGLCQLCTILQVEKPILLLDWSGNVFAFSFEECRTWSKMRVKITECFVGDSWHPMVERGYYDLVDFSGVEHTLDVRLWNRISRNLYGKTIRIDLWMESWIFNLPPQMTVKQFTEQNYELARVLSGSFDPAMSHEPHTKAGECWQRVVYITTPLGAELEVPWINVSTWTKFVGWASFVGWVHYCVPQSDELGKSNHSINELSDLADCDVFVLELETLVDAMSWQWTRPGMHVYMLFHPRHSAVRSSMVDGCFSKLLRRLETLKDASASSMKRRGARSRPPTHHEARSSKRQYSKPQTPTQTDEDLAPESRFGIKAKSGPDEHRRSTRDLVCNDGTSGYKTEERNLHQPDSPPIALNRVSVKDHFGSADPNQRMETYKKRISKSQPTEYQKRLEEAGWRRPTSSAGSSSGGVLTTNMYLQSLGMKAAAEAARRKVRERTAKKKKERQKVEETCEVSRQGDDWI